MIQRWDTTEYRRDAALTIAATAHCAICGRALTSYRNPHPMASTVDHITARAVALALGWPMSRINGRSNLQAAHRVCNLRKQAGDGTELRRPDSPWT